MKVFVVILALICAGLVFALFKQGRNTNEQVEASTKSFASLSNQVAELEVKLVLERSTATITQSNQQSALERRTLELAAMSNRLVQTWLLLSNAQHEVRSAQGELQAKAGTVMVLEAQRPELSQRAEMVAPLQKEIADIKERMAFVVTERDDLIESLGRLRTEKADLERRLDNVAFLELQLKKAEDAEAWQRRAASNARIDVSDRRVRLELQPDGTVRAALPKNEPEPRH